MNRPQNSFRNEVKRALEKLETKLAIVTLRPRKRQSKVRKVLSKALVDVNGLTFGMCEYQDTLFNTCINGNIRRLRVLLLDPAMRWCALERNSDGPRPGNIQIMLAIAIVFSNTSMISLIVAFGLENGRSAEDIIGANEIK